MIRVAELESRKIEDRDYLVYWCREEDVPDMAELNMLRHNDIASVCPMKEMRMKGSTCYCYDVTDMPGIEQFISENPDAGKVEQLCTGIREALSLAEEYMLSAEHYVGMLSAVRVWQGRPRFVFLPIKNYSAPQIQAPDLIKSISDMAGRRKGAAAVENAESRTEEIRQGNAKFSIIQKAGGQKIAVDKPVFRLGRDGHQVDYMVKNPVVGRWHATLYVEGDVIYLIDESSKNGTYIAGQRIESSKKVELHSGDVFRLGTEEFVLEAK